MCRHHGFGDGSLSETLQRSRNDSGNVHGLGQTFPGEVTLRRDASIRSVIDAPQDFLEWPNSVRDGPHEWLGTHLGPHPTRLLGRLRQYWLTLVEVLLVMQEWRESSGSSGGTMNGRLSLAWEVHPLASGRASLTCRSSIIHNERYVTFSPPIAW